MSEKIRWGLLSTARINDAVIEPIKQAERSELVAVASRNLGKAQSYAKEKGIPKAHGSYEALLSDPDIDVIYNPLPNSLHCEWSVNAAQAGKHVLCEKPIVTTLEELDKIQAAANANAEVGNRPAGAPEWTASLTGVFNQPITDRLEAFASFSMSYEDGAFSSISNSPDQERGSLYLLNLTGGVQLEQLRAVAFVDNVTDDRYNIRESQLNGVPTSGTLTRVSRGRTYGVRLIADF